ncbi:MAG: gamma-glutamylputrescine oxidase [Gammaproteobacteria bacterium]|jgi:gamma-glutamylputrescine oxidase
MKLLHANDLPGEHAPSWYNATCPIEPRASLNTNATFDVCIIGAGFTGLSTALHLAENGHSVAVLDAHRVGWGASGRNGGQLGTGFNQDQIELTALLGEHRARQLWEIAEDAKALIHTRCKQYDIDIDYTPGIVTALHKPRFIRPAHDYCEYLAANYQYQEMQPLTKQTIRQRVASDDYFGGTIDHGAGHIHPLKLASGLANACERNGAVIHEKSEVIRIDTLPRAGGYRVVTTQGSVICEKIVLATNGYLDNLNPVVNRWIMPINNFIVVTEPLGPQADEILPCNDAVADSRFVVNYYRRVDGDRLLFGGGENYSYRFPKSINKIVRRAMLGVYPQLTNVAIDYAWGGTLAITRSRLPHTSLLAEGIYTAGGFSGHGVALAGLYGQVIAEHICGDPDRFDLLSKLPERPFPGGQLARPALLALAMTGYSWVDKI